MHSSAVLFFVVKPSISGTEGDYVKREDVVDAFIALEEALGNKEEFEMFSCTTKV